MLYICKYAQFALNCMQYVCEYIQYIVIKKTEWINKKLAYKGSVKEAFTKNNFSKLKSVIPFYLNFFLEFKQTIKKPFTLFAQ